jgi:hypothetical protein
MGQDLIFSFAATGRKQRAFNADNTLSSNRGANIQEPENIFEAFTIKNGLAETWIQFELTSFLILSLKEVNAVSI